MRLSKLEFHEDEEAEEEQEAQNESPVKKQKAKKPEEGEYYNLYSIYGEGGLRGSINFSRSLLGIFKRPNFNFAKELTNDFLSQEALIEDDFLSLRY